MILSRRVDDRGKGIAADSYRIRSLAMAVAIIALSGCTLAAPMDPGQSGTPDGIVLLVQTPGGAPYLVAGQGLDTRL